MMRFPKVDRFFKYWIISLLGYCGFIFYLSSGPIHLPIKEYVGLDKVLHAVAFGLMASIAWKVLNHTSITKSPYLGAWVWCAIYGMSDEMHQAHTGRYPDVVDWAADVVGASLMLLAIRLYYRRAQRQKDVETSTNT